MSPTVIIALVEAVAQILASLVKIQAEHVAAHPISASSTPLSEGHAQQVADAARWIAEAAQRAQLEADKVTDPSTTDQPK